MNELIKIDYYNDRPTVSRPDLEEKKMFDGCFIGKKDKNGQEIRAGDRVRIFERKGNNGELEVTGQIMYSRQRSAFVFVPEKGELPCLNRPYEWSRLDDYRIKSIEVEILGESIPPGYYTVKPLTDLEEIKCLSKQLNESYNCFVSEL